MKRLCVLAAAAVASALCGWSSASAQCGYIDFENLAPNTRVSTQYPGVTFSGRNSNGTMNVNPLVVTVGNNTSSPTRALRPDGDGINEFSCDYLRMDFAVDQQLVTMSIGRTVGCSASTDTCRVRWFNAAGTQLGFRDVLVAGDPSVQRCNTYVRVGSRTGTRNIRRIEVEYGVSPSCACAFELIDDVEYDTDGTPPIALITTPGDRGCVCPNTTVPVRGTSNDPEGYQNDRLEYGRTSDGPWTLIGTSTVPEPGPNGVLYNWNTTGLSGWYHLRLTVFNDCNMESSFEEEVYIDAAPPSITLRSPGAGAIVGGGVCFDGSVVDDCTLSSYTVNYRPAAGGTFAPVDPASPTYTSAVVNDPLASWQTRTGPASVVDGTYTLRVQAGDSCGASSTLTRNVVVDNTAPVAIITNPVNCSRVEQGMIQIRGTASDLHMRSWIVQYTGGDAHGWVTIAAASTNVVDGVLATWDARALRDCCYVIRLIVTDAADVNCSGSGNQSEYTVAFDLGGSCTQDYNGDGRVNSQDYFDFLTVFFGGCP